jgi:hypothetical protein
MFTNAYSSKQYSIFCPIPQVPVVHLINVSVIFVKYSFQPEWLPNLNFTTHMFFLLPQIFSFRENFRENLTKFSRNDILWNFAKIIYL